MTGELGLPAERHGLRRGEFITLMSMVTATVAMSIDTVLPAFDQIEERFDLDGGGVSLTVTLFFVGMGAATIVYGPLADRFGRKPVLYAGFAIFILGALLSTFATSFAMFLVGRVIWGIGAAGARAVSVAMTRDCYDGDLLARTMSLIMAVFLIVPIVAPSLGDVLASIGGWRWTTGISAVIAVIVGLWFTRVNETLAPENVRDLNAARTVRAGREVLTTRTTRNYTLAGILAYGAFFPWLGSSVQMIGEIYDRNDNFALYFGANAIGMSITILTVERLVKRFGAWKVLVGLTSLSVAAAVIFLIGAVSADGVPNFWFFYAAASVLTALNAGSSPLLNSLAMQPMGHIAGTAASVTGLGLFVIGALVGGVIDSRIVDTVTPFGVGFLVLAAGTLSLVWLERPRTAAEAGQPTRAGGSP